jgi:hypothetical protein
MNSYKVIGVNEPEFYHSGIMGMKWGKRRYQNSDGSLTPLGRSHYGVGEPRKTTTKKTTETKSSSKTSSSGETKKKTINEMTNEELDAYITRLEKVKRVKELNSSIASADNAKKESRGKKMVNKAIDNVGPVIIGSVITYAVGGAINKALNDKVVKGGKGYIVDEKKKDKN